MNVFKIAAVSVLLNSSGDKKQVVLFSVKLL